MLAVICLQASAIKLNAGISVRSGICLLGPSCPPPPSLKSGALFNRLSLPYSPTILFASL